MASFIGNISAFNKNTETFVHYADRMQSFMTANSVENDVKVHTFLALVGVEACTLLKNLCSPEKLSTKSYQELIKLLSDHYSPKPIEIAERDRFWNCNTHVTSFINPAVIPRFSADSCFSASADHRRIFSTLNQVVKVRQRTSAGRRRVTVRRSPDLFRR